MSAMASQNHRRLNGFRAQINVTGLCEGNSPVTGGFPSQRTSNAEKFPFDYVFRNKAMSHKIHKVLFCFVCCGFILPLQLKAIETHDGKCSTIHNTHMNSLQLEDSTFV